MKTTSTKRNGARVTRTGNVVGMTKAYAVLVIPTFNGSDAQINHLMNDYGLTMRETQVGFVDNEFKSLDDAKACAKDWVESGFIAEVWSSGGPMMKFNPEES
jgi:hypothetical protein